MRTRLRFLLSGLVVATLLLAACGGDEEPTAAPAPTEAPTEAPTVAPTEAPTEAPAASEPVTGTEEMTATEEM